MAPKKHKPQGHYCKVCGEHKANEKFSGKGHAAHICKACMKLAPAERSEQMTLNKIEGMAFRYLNESEIKWLRNRMKDSRPEVREAAAEAHSIKFPHYERSMFKKGLTAFSLEFYIHGEVWDEWGDEIPVHMRFDADSTGAFRRIDYSAPENERETEIKADPKEARKFLKSVVHELNTPFWGEDLSDTGPSDDPYIDVQTEYRDFENFIPDLDEDYDDFDGYIEDDTEETEPSANKDREPVWSLCLELSNGENREITFYHQMHDESQALFWSLNDWFEPDDDGFDDDESDNGGPL